MAPLRKRLLVVDDEDAIRESLSLGLEDYGWEVTECASCSSALDFDIPFDAYLIDLSMPGEDGFELACNLCKRFGKRPIVMLTGYLNPDLEKEAQNYNIAAVMKKPFKFDELDRVLKDLTEPDRPN